MQGSKIVLVHSYLRVSQAAGQVNILIFLLKIKFSPCMPINFVMQGKCLFSDISRPVYVRENLKAQPSVVLRRWGSQLKVSSVNWWSRRSCGYFILILKSALSLYHFMMTSYGLTLKLKYFMLQLKLGKAAKKVNACGPMEVPQLGYRKYFETRMLS